MKQSHVYIGIAVLLAAFLSGCAHKGPLLLDFTYQPPKGTTAMASKVTVGVSPFKDERGKVESVIGKRFMSLSNETNDLVVQGAVSDKVTTALKNALKARDIPVKDIAAWDLTDTGIRADGANLLISGEIKTLWVESTSSLANTTVKADVQLRVLVADTAEKKIIRTVNVNSMMERQNITYSSAFVEETLAEALSTAIDQIFADAELKNRLK
jgi:hypothetical protein